MLGDGFLARRAQTAGPDLDIRRIGENDIEAPPRAVGPEIRPHDPDPAPEAVQGDVAAGQGGRFGLDFQGDQEAERPGAEQKRNNPVSSPQLQDFVPGFDFHEIGQEGGVQGKTIARLRLNDANLAAVELIQGFVRRWTVVFHAITPVRSRPIPQGARPRRGIPTPAAR